MRLGWNLVQPALQFGKQRLLEVVRQIQAAPLEQSVDLLLKAIYDWSGDSPICDDLSIVAVESER